MKVKTLFNLFGKAQKKDAPIEKPGQPEWIAKSDAGERKTAPGPLLALMASSEPEFIPPFLIGFRSISAAASDHPEIRFLRKRVADMRKQFLMRQQDATPGIPGAAVQARPIQSLFTQDSELVRLEGEVLALRLRDENRSERLKKVSAERERLAEELLVARAEAEERDVEYKRRIGEMENELIELKSALEREKNESEYKSRLLEDKEKSLLNLARDLTGGSSEGDGSQSFAGTGRRESGESILDAAERIRAAAVGIEAQKDILTELILIGKHCRERLEGIDKRLNKN
ncbi:MAG: hypothetical protein K2H64_07390 [Desulfovibrio sp.]|nr:hypothetical protein [Desulfovibrio sp.]